MSRIFYVPPRIEITLDEPLTVGRRDVVEAALRAEESALPRVCGREDCRRPFDQQEGRYCVQCLDYRATCWNNHCMDCGGTT